MELSDDPALQPVRVLVEEHLGLTSSVWTAGTPGAAARFVREPGEAAHRSQNSVLTARGGLQVFLPSDAVAIAYETPSARDPLRWHQTVALCVPDEVARRSVRTVVTELGPDAEAMRPQDVDGVLFDLGLGALAADVLVRTTDPDALAVLRRAEGHDLLDLDVNLAAALATPAAHAVVLTAAGRVEVLAPATEARAGPHLRLRPARARQLPAPPSHLPIPAGWTTVLRLHPAHPAQEPDGRTIPFDPDRHSAFQALLAQHGDPVLGVIAADVVDAVRAMHGPHRVPLSAQATTRAAVAATLRRMIFTDGMSATLTSWRNRYEGGSDTTDPDED